MEDLEIDFRETAQKLESEGNHSNKNEDLQDRAKQGSELDVLMKSTEFCEGNVTQQVHDQSHFLKFNPSQDPDLKSKFQNFKNLMGKFSFQICQIHKSLEEKVVFKILLDLSRLKSNFLI